MNSFMEFFALSSRPDVAYDNLRILKQGEGESTGELARFCSTNTTVSHLAKLFFNALIPRNKLVLKGKITDESTYKSLADIVIETEGFFNASTFNVNSVQEFVSPHENSGIESRLVSLEGRLSSLVRHRKLRR